MAKKSSPTPSWDEVTDRKASSANTPMWSEQLVDLPAASNREPPIITDNQKPQHSTLPTQETGAMNLQTTAASFLEAENLSDHGETTSGSVATAQNHWPVLDWSSPASTASSLLSQQDLPSLSRVLMLLLLIVTCVLVLLWSRLDLNETEVAVHKAQLEYQAALEEQHRLQLELSMLGAPVSVESQIKHWNLDQPSKIIEISE